MAVYKTMIERLIFIEQLEHNFNWEVNKFHLTMVAKLNEIFNRQRFKQAINEAYNI